ncbi:MAG: GNAT family N-acetyltransferase [Thermoleophilia bacterium]
MRIETERLLLRALDEMDIDALVDLWTDPQVTAFLGGPRDPDELRRSFGQDLGEQGADRYDLWPVVERSSGMVVGHCGLLGKEVDGVPEVELVYVLASSAWGKGYATEIGRALLWFAFEEMGLPRLICLIDPGNEASGRVAERLGMRLEGMTARPGNRTLRVYAISTPAWRMMDAPRPS